MHRMMRMQVPQTKAVQGTAAVTMTNIMHRHPAAAVQRLRTMHASSWAINMYMAEAA